MASKRANPFLEDFVPQRKVHIGLKQFNNNVEGMKSVHVKTLDLLFKGAKRPVRVNDDDGDSEQPARWSRAPSGDTKTQLIITKDGKLEHSDKMETIKPVSIGKCKCGKWGESRCGYCEVERCASCLHTCWRCRARYCPLCLLIGFEDGEVCISCCR